MIWCAALGSFALSSSYVLALLLLFVAGFVELSFNSMAQTLVQLNAPPEMRGRAIGVYNMRSEEHTSELQSLMRISYAVFCLKKKTTNNQPDYSIQPPPTEQDGRTRDT